MQAPNKLDFFWKKSRYLRKTPVKDKLFIQYSQNYYWSVYDKNNSKCRYDTAIVDY